MSHLEKIERPGQLADLSLRELRAVGDEIRELIVRTVATNGGHLASNLGVVELTLALLSRFDPAKDRIVWDVGHQCYPFKLLTGRREQFATLRQYQGMSGFPLRTESPADAFGAGHASTAISAALGLARARDLRGESHHVVAIIGDGALTGGMCWEAINNAGVGNTDLLVVLNDNEMSISRSEGALAQHIGALRSWQTYRAIEDGAERLMQHVPVTGPLLVKAGQLLKRGVTQWISRAQGAIVEALGFTYIGPIGGHDLSLMRDIFAHVRVLKGPVLVHVVTKKGKGYNPAESDARRYHGVGPFDASTGDPESSGGPSFSKAFGEALIRAAEKMPDVVGITAAMPDGTGLTPFAKRFPDRYFDVGIAEEHAVTFAAALAAGGIKPVLAVYSTFLQRAYDQIVHDVCLQKLPVVFAIDRAGIVGEDGPTHQGVFDIAFLRHVPNLALMTPRSGAELQAMLRLALASGGPCAIRYPRDGNPGALDEPIPPVEMGKADVVKQGCDIALVTVGDTVARCLAAAALLEEHGFSVAVVNARFVKPLDEELLLQVAESVGTFVTVEEHVAAGGFGSAVLEALHRGDLPLSHVLNIALPDEFIPHGSAKLLRRDYGLTPEAIADRVLRFHHERSAPPVVSEPVEALAG